jgi:hypothetical protein
MLPGRSKKSLDVCHYLPILLCREIVLKPGQQFCSTFDIMTIDFRICSTIRISESLIVVHIFIIAKVNSTNTSFTQHGMMSKVNKFVYGFGQVWILKSDRFMSNSSDFSDNSTKSGFG